MELHRNPDPGISGFAKGVSGPPLAGLGTLLILACFPTEYKDVTKDRCPTQPGLPEHQGCPYDGDKDGMNDWWEKEMGLSLVSNDAGLDTDGDSLTHGQEFRKDTDSNLAGTDANGVNDDADACPRQPGAPAGNGCPA